MRYGGGHNQIRLNRGLRPRADRGSHGSRADSEIAFSSLAGKAIIYFTSYSRTRELIARSTGVAGII